MIAVVGSGRLQERTKGDHVCCTDCGAQRCPGEYKFSMYTETCAPIIESVKTELPHGKSQAEGNRTISSGGIGNADVYVCF